MWRILEEGENIYYDKNNMLTCTVCICALHVKLTSRGLPYLICLQIKIFLIYKEIHMGSVAKSYLRKGFLIYEEMLKYLVIYEKAVSHIWLWNCSRLNFLIYEEYLFSFLSVYYVDTVLRGIRSKICDTLRRRVRIPKYSPHYFSERLHRSCRKFVAFL